MRKLFVFLYHHWAHLAACCSHMFATQRCCKLQGYLEGWCEQSKSCIYT